MNILKDAESADSSSKVSSDSIIIKHEPGLQSPPDTPSSAVVKREKVSTRIARNAHITLLHLMQMQDPPKLHGPLQRNLHVARRAADLAQPGIYDCVEIL
jgi:hypothetical protein